MLEKYIKRDSRFEALRILSMFFIVVSHCSVFGNWNSPTAFKGLQFQPFGQVGVDIFVLISGYFLSRKAITIKQGFKRTKRIWIETIFYSWVLLIINLLFHLTHTGITNAAYSIFPILLISYWFMSAFVILMLLTPLLNSLILKESKKVLLFYIFLFILVIQIIPIIETYVVLLGSITSAGSLITAYLIAGYIQKYKVKAKNWQAILLIIIGLGFEYISMPLLQALDKDTLKATYGVLPLIASIGLFLLTQNLKPIHSKVINWLAESVLATYLITTNVFTKIWIWSKHFLNIAQYQHSPFLTLIACGISFLIVLACILIDKVCELIYLTIAKKIKTPNWLKTL